MRLCRRRGKEGWRGEGGRGKERGGRERRKEWESSGEGKREEEKGGAAGGGGEERTIRKQAVRMSALPSGQGTEAFAINLLRCVKSDLWMFSLLLKAVGELGRF